jgi:hypothetical protein
MPTPSPTIFPTLLPAGTESIQHGINGYDVSIFIACFIIIFMYAIGFYSIKKLVVDLNSKTEKLEKQTYVALIFGRNNVHYFTTVSTLTYILLAVLLLDILLMNAKIIDSQVGIPIITSILGYVLANKTAEIAQSINGNKEDPVDDKNIKEISTNKDNETFELK